MCEILKLLFKSLVSPSQDEKRKKKKGGVKNTEIQNEFVMRQPQLGTAAPGKVSGCFIRAFHEKRYSSKFLVKQSI